MRSSPVFMAAVLFLSASSSSAAIIDFGGFFRDTDSGLDWLDVTSTLGLSYDDIVGGAGGWVTAGWRHATSEELCVLWNAGPSCFHINTISLSTSIAQANQGFLNLFGFVTTCCTGGGEVFTTTGLLERAGQPASRSPFGELQFFEAGFNPRARVTWFNNAGSSFSRPDIGNFMVRVVVPCPGDADGNNSVDLEDLNLVLFNFGSAVPVGTNGDVDGTGQVDLEDLNLVLFNFSTTC